MASLFLFSDSGADSDDAKSLSSQHTIDALDVRYELGVPLQRMGPRRAPASGLRHSGLFLLNDSTDSPLDDEDEDEEDEVHDQDSVSDRDDDFDDEDGDGEQLEYDDERRPRGDSIDWDEENDENLVTGTGTELQFSRNHSWEHVWRHSSWPPSESVHVDELIDTNTTDLLRLSSVTDEISSNDEDYYPSDSSFISSPRGYRRTSIIDSNNMISHVPAASPTARLAVRLNSPSLRRDPWNLVLPMAVLTSLTPVTTSFDLNDGHHDDEDDDAEDSQNIENGDDAAWAFLVSRGGKNALRAWDDPPLATLRDAFDLVQQLLEGLVFFHEHGLVCVPLSESNIVMDIGLAPLDTTSSSSSASAFASSPTLDRATYPVKYYLASIEGLKSIKDVHTDKSDTDAFGTDLITLAHLIERLFISVPGTPFAPLCQALLHAGGASDAVTTFGRNEKLSSPTSCSKGQEASPFLATNAGSPLFPASANYGDGELYYNYLNGSQTVTDASSALELLHDIVKSLRGDPSFCTSPLFAPHLHASESDCLEEAGGNADADADGPDLDHKRNVLTPHVMNADGIGVSTLTEAVR